MDSGELVEFSGNVVGEFVRGWTKCWAGSRADVCTDCEEDSIKGEFGNVLGECEEDSSKGSAVSVLCEGDYTKKDGGAEILTDLESGLDYDNGAADDLCWPIVGKGGEGKEDKGAVVKEGMTLNELLSQERNCGDWLVLGQKATVSVVAKGKWFSSNLALWHI